MKMNGKPQMMQGPNQEAIDAWSGSTSPEEQKADLMEAALHKHSVKKSRRPHILRVLKEYDALVEQYLKK